MSAAEKLRDVAFRMRTCAMCNHAQEVEAIAATLGGGKLTAEQVCKAVNNHGNIMDNRLYENWQAVADELNSALGGGECENVAPDYLDFLCSACGLVHYHSDENDTGDGNDWAFCPRCERAVKR